MKLKTKKYYKNLYENEHENMVKLTRQCSKLSQERVEMEKKLKATWLELHDTKGFLAQEKECNEALRKERKKLRTMITKLGGNWKDGN